MREAAFKFDPNHPSSGSTEAFNVDSMTPVVFKEMLKLTFNLKVDRAELGAILKEFKPDLAAGNNTSIPSADFLRYFLRIGKSSHTRSLILRVTHNQMDDCTTYYLYFIAGIDLRDKAVKEQRQKQMIASQQMEEMRRQKKKEAEDKMQQEVNFNFSERDEISAKEKLRSSSMKYDR